MLSSQALVHSEKGFHGGRGGLGSEYDGGLCGGGGVRRAPVTAKARRKPRCSCAQTRAHVGSASSSPGQSTTRWLERICQARATGARRARVDLRGARGGVCKCALLLICARMEPKNAFKVLMNPEKTIDPIVWAVIYAATLVRVDDGDPLLGTAYIGQSVRQGATATEVANERWTEHRSLSSKKDCEFGFIAALRIFGTRAFDWTILYSCRGKRSEMQKWADRVESEEICKRGGVLTDMNPEMPIKQTFNRQPGGKPFTYWPAVEARCAENWRRFKSEMSQYVDDYKTADIRWDFVTSSGYRLGKKVTMIRSHGQFLTGRPDEADRRAWLEALPGWTYDGRKSERYVSEQSTRHVEWWQSLTPEEYDALRSKNKEALARPEVRAKMSKNATMQFASIEARSKLSESAKAQWQTETPTQRAKRVENRSIVESKPEVMARRKAAMQRVQSDPELRGRISKTRIANEAVKRRAWLLKARVEALPWQKRARDRIKGAYYRHPDGTIRVCLGNGCSVMKVLGTARDE